jgi:hypothetical protein
MFDAVSKESPPRRPDQSPPLIDVVERGAGTPLDGCRSTDVAPHLNA